MNILMAASCSSNRNLGVPGVMYSLADEFKAAGHEVRMLFRDAPGRIPEMLFGWRLAKAARDGWADLVDSHAVEAWPLSAFKRRPAVVARSHGLEIVVHRRLMESAKAGSARVSPVYWTYRGSLRLYAERMSIRTADASLLLNQADYEICRDEFRAPVDRLHLVRNGYPSYLLEGDIEPDPNPGIAFVGSWIHRKGNDLAIQAIVLLLSEFPDLQVLLAGTGAPAEEVLSSFPENVRKNIEVRQHFQRAELPGLTRGKSVLLFPSRSEGSPLALIEAMATGIAPVATAIPGVVEVIESGKSGILVPPEDPRSLARAVAELLRDPERLSALRSGSREKVRDRSWDRIATEQLGIYGQILSRRNLSQGGERR